MILQYLAGRIERIEELEQERLRLDGRRNGGEHFYNDFLWNEYQVYATLGGL